VMGTMVITFMPAFVTIPVRSNCTLLVSKVTQIIKLMVEVSESYSCFHQIHDK
jgi:hypothetical protein